MKDIEIKIADLKEPTVKALVNVIVEKAGDSTVKPENVKVFMKTTKLNHDKTLEEEGVSDDATLFTFIKKEPKKSEAPSSAANNANQGTANQAYTAPNTNPYTAQNSNPYGAAGSPYGANPYASMGGMPFSSDMAASILNDPQMVENMINMMFPNAPEEQKEMMRSQFRAMSQNPEMMNMAMQMAGMGGMPGTSPNNFGGMNPNNFAAPPAYGSPVNSASTAQTPPPNGPCSHGFYPMHVVKANQEETENKLKTLEGMGFMDKEKNKAALEKAGGSIEGAIEELTKK